MSAKAHSTVSEFHTRTPGCLALISDLKKLKRSMKNGWRTLHISLDSAECREARTKKLSYLLRRNLLP
jgi:hypothetical protein